MSVKGRFSAERIKRISRYSVTRFSTLFGDKKLHLGPTAYMNRQNGFARSFVFVKDIRENSRKNV